MHRLLFVFICCTTGLLAERVNLEEDAKLLFSHLILPASGYVNAHHYGKAFNFHTIARDAIGAEAQFAHGIAFELSAAGDIVALHDGKRAPLVLGSIPRSKDDLKELRNAYNLRHDAQLFVFSLNKKFERDKTGLTAALQGQENILLFKYPTTDFCAPSVVDMIRVVRDLKNRDDAGAALVLVHCKSGKGRSACAISAYLLCILFEAGIEVTPDQIEHYLKAHRSQVHLNDDHKKALVVFQAELKRAGSFDMLYAWYRHKIIERDKAVQDK